MAWEIEYQHVDLTRMTHETGYIDRGVFNTDGEPARHFDVVLLGADGLSNTRGPGSSNFELKEDGRLFDADGNEIVIRERQKEMLDRLTGLHARGRAFAARHNTEIVKATKRT